MKSVTLLSKRFRVALTLLTALVVLPLGSALHPAQAKPKSGAPAYGYRAKHSGSKRHAKRNRRNDRNTARRNNRNDRYDDRRNDDRYNDDRDDRYNDDRNNDDRDYTPRYRTRRSSTGDQVREYLRSYTGR